MFDPTRSALVLLDCEEGVAGRAFADDGARAAFAANLRSVVEAGLGAGIPCVRVEVEFRAGHPEIAASNSYFAAVRKAGRLESGSDEVAPMAELAALLAPLTRVVKRRIGGLVDTDLQPLLRGLGCDGVVLAGLITRGAIVSTSAHAADLDYRVTILSDACYDPDPAVHEALIAHVLPLRGQVISAAEFVAGAAEMA